MDIQDKCVQSYRRIKNLKLVGEELGIPWQTVYVHLRAVGEPVTGDKLRYGSDTDRFAARAERKFNELVPFAISQNEKKFQSKVDFMVGDSTIDVKAANLKNNRWSFSLKKQENIADFFVCFAFSDDGTYRVVMIPGDVCRNIQTISLGVKGSTRWWDYEISPSELTDFFKSIRN